MHGRERIVVPISPVDTSIVFNPGNVVTARIVDENGQTIREGFEQLNLQGMSQTIIPLENLTHLGEVTVELTIKGISDSDLEDDIDLMLPSASVNIAIE